MRLKENFRVRQERLVLIFGFCLNFFAAVFCVGFFFCLSRLRSLYTMNPVYRYFFLENKVKLTEEANFTP